MEDREIKQIEEQIRILPKGSITVKHIHGREYEYWQYRENGKQISKRVKGEELETLRAQINERKRLELFLDSLRNSDTMQDTLSVVSENSPQGLIRTGDDLIRFTEPVRKFHKRELFPELSDYIYGPDNDRVFIMYGLRRTGKTTMIRQLILDMSPEMKKRTAFIQISPNETLAMLNKDLKISEFFYTSSAFHDQYSTTLSFS